jgi:TonB family protein
MLGVLLESRAGKQRRTGGAMLSVCAHVLIGGAAIGATAAHAKSAPIAVPKDTTIVFKVVPAVNPSPARSTTTRFAGVPRLPSITISHIAVPTITPTAIPPIDLSKGASDSIVIGGGRSAGDYRGVSLLSDGPSHGGDGSGPWSGDELLMHLLQSSKPRYPESLRQANVDGLVLVRFTVDTMGRIDMSSVRVVSSTHDLFSTAVRSALPGFRFKPAESGGRKVAALAEMPFEFTLGR